MLSFMNTSPAMSAVDPATVEHCELLLPIATRKAPAVVQLRPSRVGNGVICPGLGPALSLPHTLPAGKFPEHCDQASLDQMNRQKNAASSLLMETVPKCRQT